MHALIHQGAGFGSFMAAAAKCPSTVEMLVLAMWYGGLMLWLACTSPWVQSEALKTQSKRKDRHATVLYSRKTAQTLTRNWFCPVVKGPHI